MGEHGDSQFIPVSHIQIGGIPVKEYLSIHPEYRDKMDFDKISAEDKVCGFHIVEGKGCTEFGIGAVLSNIAKEQSCMMKRESFLVSVLLGRRIWRTRGSGRSAMCDRQKRCGRDSGNLPDRERKRAAS